MPALGIFVLAAGCRTPPPPVPTQGLSSFSVVAPPARPHGQARPSDLPPPEDRRRFVSAEPIPPLALPVYPAAALAARAGWAIVGVRITIDERGRVSDVQSSPVSLSTPTPYADSFRTAVENAVKKWRFFPAEYRNEHSRLVDGGYVWDLVNVEKTPSTSDLSFNFTAAGTVTSGAGH